MQPERNDQHRFCGIDIGKAKHMACILDADGRFLARSQSFLNNAAGYEQLLARLQQAGGPPQVRVAMEATGHYWYSLHDFLVRQAYPVSVLNPIQTSQQAKMGIRKKKTDKTDARHIAVLLKNGESRAALIPGEPAMTCRQLTRLRYALIKQRTQTKQRIWSHLHPVWPEYEGLFSDPFGTTGRKLLTIAPTPADLLAMDAPTLGEMIRRTSRGRFGPVKVQQILDAARGSVGMQRGLDGARIGIRTLIATLDALRPIREQLDADILARADQLPQYILTLPGADPLRAVSLYGETDPIRLFASPDQLVAFSGLDCTVFQTGQFLAPQRHISKRGSPFLRRTLWAMAHRAVCREGELRDYWRRKRRQGLHHLAAVTATAVKLCRISWRIMTDQRDYVPAACPTISSTAANSS